MSKVLKLTKLIRKIYATKDGSSGGHAHIVFDDGNVDKECVLFCIKQAKANTHKLSEETNLYCLDALNMCLEMEENEIEEAIEFFWTLRENEL